MLQNKQSLKIYFAGAIRGGRENTEIYTQLIKFLNTKGEVLTEHIGQVSLQEKGELEETDSFIYKRDMKWLQLSDCVIAEVTTPSLGVGYELGVTESLKKPVLCLYRAQEGKRLSAMIGGNDQFICRKYEEIKEAKNHIINFLNQL